MEKQPVLSPYALRSSATMVNTGLSDKIPFSFGAADYEKKEPPQHEFVSADGKKKKKITRITGDCLKLLLDLGIPGLTSLPTALDWDGPAWFSGITEGLVGPPGLKRKSLPTKDYARSKNNRTLQNVQQTLSNLVTKLFGTLYPGDKTCCWLKSSKSPIGLLDPFETPEY